MFVTERFRIFDDAREDEFEAVAVSIFGRTAFISGSDDDGTTALPEFVIKGCRNNAVAVRRFV